MFSSGHGCMESPCIAVTEHLLGNCKDSNNYRVDGGPLPLLELSASPLSTMPSTSIGVGGWRIDTVKEVCWVPDVKVGATMKLSNTGFCGFRDISRV